LLRDLLVQCEKQGRGWLFLHDGDPELAFCSIRNLSIDDPFYTYCANRPHRRPDDAIPIGPVFIFTGEGREEWQDSTDTEEVREHLLALLADIPEQPQPEYPVGYYAD
jgi:hypothetical protein